MARLHGSAASVQVTVPVTSLLGVGEDPAELAGYGPITADVARRIAAQGSWRRLLTDPASGAVLDYGRQVYRPPQDLTELILARDQTCRHPTCEQPARLCEVDHTVRFHADGGTTGSAGLGALCRVHHTLKDDAGWRLEQPEPGRFTWTSPSGHVYDVEPQAVGLISEMPRQVSPPPEPESDPPDQDLPPF